mgnify:FL=1
MKITKDPTNNKVCTMCKTEKSFTEFGGKKDGWLDLEGNRHKWHCRACDYKYIQELHMKKPYVRLFHLAKRRAQKKELLFTITMQDVKRKFPKDNICPVTKKPFLFGKENRDLNPSIDRIDNTKGYTYDNIAIVSYVANRIKNNLTSFDIFKNIVNYYEN